MKRKLKILIFNIIIVFLLFILFELAIRIGYPEIKLSGTSKNILIDSLHNSSVGLKKNTTGISLGAKKSTNQYNSWKYKNELSPKGPIDLYLGDSAVMGIGIENDSTFVGILSSSRNILNPSLIGYSVMDYKNVLLSFISKKEIGSQIKRVFLFWTLNDVYDNFETKSSPEIGNENILFPVIKFLRQNSKAFIFIKHLISDRSEIYYRYDKQYYTSENLLDKSIINNLDEISRICRVNNIELTLCLLPYEYQLREGYERNSEPQQVIIEHFKSSGNRIIDLGVLLSHQRQNFEELYLYKDGIHFSIMGHKQIAKILMDEV
jgi:hypothetical protein